MRPQRIPRRLTISATRFAAATAVVLTLGPLAPNAGPSSFGSARTVASISVQDRAARPDQVVVLQRRGRGTTTVAGTVVEASLSQILVETRDGQQRKFDSGQVVRIALGDVPSAFQDAGTLFERGEYVDASVQYRMAVDASSRSVVRAAARLESARALVMAGTRDPSYLTEAIAEVGKFKQSHGESHNLPEARRLEALAKRLSGDAAGAAADYRALFDESGGGKPTDGYSIRLCYLSAAWAAEAYLAAGDAANARALFASISTDLPGVLADLDADDPARQDLTVVEAAARLAEGYALLAEGKSSRARAFFDSQLSQNGKDTIAALRFGAHLGLGEALLAEGDASAAILEFAQVSALDFTDRNRSARALLGLARCAVELDSSAYDARTWLDAIAADYSDTPSGPAAAALRQTL